ncbi:MFS general substrate transporter [Colletotrichum falcatum]|nr:MFS general substrate transporter [Colletotrichum falcatum]
MATARRSLDKDEAHITGHRPFAEVHLEKVPEAIDVNGFRVFGLSAEDADFYTNYPAEKRKEVFRKVDVRLLPMLSLMYLICHIDRANIGNAKVEGMVQDLGMTGVQYNTVLSVFFIPYVLFKVPSNILLKKFKRPSTYLGGLALAWGIVVTCTGLVKNFAGLMVPRVLLGTFGAGFFPGAIYLTSFWYEPKDLSSCISFFYCASALSGAFSGLLAAGIAELDGLGGLEGWRWIFLLEGMATIVIGGVCFFLLVDTPALSTAWLGLDEIRYLELSILIKQGGGSRGESGGGGRRVDWEDVGMMLANWRIYVQAYFLVCQSALSYGIKFTLPTITKAMGFATTEAQLLSAPPHVAAAAASAVAFAKVSDLFFWRMSFLVIPLGIVAVAYSVILSFGGTGLMVALLLGCSYKSGSARKAEMADEARAKYTEQELFRMGDRSPLFKYVLQQSTPVIVFSRATLPRASDACAVPRRAPAGEGDASPFRILWAGCGVSKSNQIRVSQISCQVWKHYQSANPRRHDRSALG